MRTYMMYDGGRRAFTLVEILCVAAIIAVLSALTVPALLSAKRASTVVPVISNMRQCLTSIAIYRVDSDASFALPSLDAMKSRVPSELIWDPLDTWTDANKSPALPEMLGSFGYAGALRMHDRWVEKGDGVAVLVNIFHEAEQIPKPKPIVHGEPLDPATIAFLPKSALVGRLDTSVDRHRFRWFEVERMVLFNWFRVFMNLNNPGQELHSG